MTTDELMSRGFVHSNLPTFYGFCASCDAYRGHDWLESPPPFRHHYARCQACGIAQLLPFQRCFIEKHFPVHQVIA